MSCFLVGSFRISALTMCCCILGLGCGRIGFEVSPLPGDVEQAGDGDGDGNGGVAANGDGDGDGDGTGGVAANGDRDGMGGITDGGIADGGTTPDGGMQDGGPACDAPAPSDVTCDGVDDDCDGHADEDYMPLASMCGVGACAAVGATRCSGASIVDDCTAGAPAPSDVTCDGVDDDCDGNADEDYMVTPTSCGVGECTGNSGSLACAAGRETDSCDPVIGASAELCADGLDNDCDGSTDGADSSCSGNRPPVAVAAVSPGLGTTATTFFADASGCSDIEDAVGALSFSWDWDGDGTFDDTGVLVSHNYASPGRYQVLLAVDDTGGARDWASFDVIVLPDASEDLIVVTTGIDESDSGATPASPGGMGLSLREAIAYADAQPGRQSIWVPSGTVVLLDSGLQVDMSDLDIVGDGATLQGPLSGKGACLLINTSNVFVAGLEITGCGTQTFQISNGTNNQLARLYIHDNTAGAYIQTSGNTVGPDNRFDGNSGARAMDFAGVTTVRGNVFSNQDDAAIFVSGGGSGSELYGNTFFLTAGGILVASQVTQVTIAHNTFDSIDGSALLCGGNAGGIDFRNNIVSRNQGWGLNCNASDFDFRDHNALFDSGIGHCSGCNAVYGPNSLVDVDPQYIDAGGFDLRLTPDSPLVDQGTDLGYDLNSLSPGRFNGAAPDIGAHETQ